jgi:hypothetical protein
LLAISLGKRRTKADEPFKRKDDSLENTFIASYGGSWLAPAALSDGPGDNLEKWISFGNECLKREERGIE